MSSMSHPSTRPLHGLLTLTTPFSPEQAEQKEAALFGWYMDVQDFTYSNTGETSWEQPCETALFAPFRPHFFVERQRLKNVMKTVKRLQDARLVLKRLTRGAIGNLRMEGEQWHGYDVTEDWLYDKDKRRKTWNRYCDGGHCNWPNMVCRCLDLTWSAQRQNDMRFAAWADLTDW
jgi:hypothetical protein